MGLSYTNICGTSESPYPVGDAPYFYMPKEAQIYCEHKLLLDFAKVCINIKVTSKSSFLWAPCISAIISKWATIWNVNCWTVSRAVCSWKCVGAAVFALSALCTCYSAYCSIVKPFMEFNKKIQHLKQSILIQLQDWIYIYVYIYIYIYDHTNDSEQSMRGVHIL